MIRWLLPLALCSACTGGSQITVVFEGDVVAKELDILFAEPHVFLKRSQRTNVSPLPDVSQETAFYVIPRLRLVHDLGEEQPLAGVELQLIGAEGHLPIVRAHDAGGNLVGMGILDPDQVFFDDPDRPDRTEQFPTSLFSAADVTRFPILIEPASSAPVSAGGKPVSIGEGAVMEVTCAAHEGISGLIWRPQGQPDRRTGQLRIVLPFDDTFDARPRVDQVGFDLDCDQHTPLLRAEVLAGDEVDCDDTCPDVFGGDMANTEACDFIDGDCDPNTVGASVMRNDCATCAGTRLMCYEGFEQLIANQGCAQQVDNGCMSCNLVTKTGGMGLVACNQRAELTLPPECGASCLVRLVDADPAWSVKIGDIGAPIHGLYVGYVPTSLRKIGIQIAPADGNVGVSPGLVGTALIAYHIDPADPTKPVRLIEISMSVANTTVNECGLVEAMTCTPES